MVGPTFKQLKLIVQNLKLVKGIISFSQSIPNTISNYNGISKSLNKYMTMGTKQLFATMDN